MDKARAYVNRVGFVEPARTVFPKLPTGNFYAHPINRQTRVEGKYPAHGWEGSGFDVANRVAILVQGGKVLHLKWEN